MNKQFWEKEVSVEGGAEGTLGHCCECAQTATVALISLVHGILKGIKAVVSASISSSNRALLLICIS